MGCEDSRPPFEPASRLGREAGTIPDGPMPEQVLEAYSAAFASGDLETLRGLLSEEFLYEVDNGCAPFASCGDTFPWDRDHELAWLGRLIAIGDERGCTFYPYEPATLPGHRWRVIAGMNLYVRRPTGGYTSCDGSLVIELGPDGHGGLLVERMKPRRWFRDDDGCGLVHFRCLI